MAPRGRSTTLGIDIVANDKGASKVFADQRKQVAGLGEEVQKTAALVGGGFAVYQGFDKLNEAARAASSLNETQSTANQVFGESVDRVREFASAAADAYGQSERASLQAMNGFGAMLNNMGLARDASAEWSTTLAALGSDLAAAWDTDVPAALAAIQSGLAGQAEPLRRYGIDLTQASLAQDAIALGLDKNITKLDREQKALVILTSIMRQSSDAQGQFTRESGGLAAQTAIAAANAENAQASFGQGLIPIFTKLQQLVGGTARAFDSLPGPLKTVASTGAAATLAAGGLGVAIGILGPGLATARTAMVGLGVAAKTTAMNLIVPTTATKGLGAAQATTTTTTVGLTAALRSQVGTLGMVKTGLLAAAAGYGAYSLTQSALKSAASSDASPAKLGEDLQLLADGAISANDAVREVTAGIGGLAQKIDLYRNASVLQKLVPIGDSGIIDSTKAKNDIAELDKALATMVESGNGEAARKAAGELFAALAEQGVEVDDIGASFRRYLEALGRWKEGAYRATDAAEDHTDALEDETTAVEKLLDAMKARHDAVEREWQAERSAADAVEGRLEAQAELQEATRAATGNSREYRDATKAVADAQGQLADAHRGVTDAQRDLNEARREAAERLDDLRDKVEDLRTAEKRADLDRRKAEADAATAAADPRLTALEKEDARLRAEEAAAEQAQTTRDRADAEGELAEARRRGIEGDEQVIEAKRGIADAENRVREAAEGVTEAQARQRDVLIDAKDRVREATRNLEDALLNEADAWGDLRELQDGATAGVQGHIDKLHELEVMLGPDSPLTRMLAERRAELESIDGGVAGIASAIRAGSPLAATVFERFVAPSLTVHTYGTPEQTRRATVDKMQGFLDDLAKGAR